MQELWKISQLTSNPKDFYFRQYSQTLLHELSHMASSNYDSETKTSLCGFDKFPTDNESEKNRGLTKGYTEILSMAGVPGTIEISLGYYIEASLKKFSIIKEKYQMYLNESIKSTSIKM